MEDILFSIGPLPVTTRDLISIIGIMLVFVLVYLGISRLVLPVLMRKKEISQAKVVKGRYLLVIFLGLLLVEIGLSILEVEATLFRNISLTLLIESAILMVMIYVVLWIASNVYFHSFFTSREKNITEEQKSIEAINERAAINTLKWLLFAIAIMILQRYIDWDYTLWVFKSPREGSPDILIRISSILTTLIIFLIARLSTWVGTQIILHRYYRKQRFDAGISYSLTKLFSYLAYFIASIVALRNLGMDLGLLLGGAAALLVGIGLALQSTFSDFFAGLVLLFERPIKVGDYISFEGKPVLVQKIGLRASHVKNRDSINFIIPNSKLIMQPVVNWSHDEKSVRFHIVVGVAYGSDTIKVEELLLQAASSHRDVMKKPKPKVIFADFADSSLSFHLYFYSQNIYNAEWVKSDLRFKVDQLFRENGITIPFPQRDVWMRK